MSSQGLSHHMSASSFAMADPVRIAQVQAFKDWFLRSTLFILALSSPFVWMEPAPYDLLLIILMPVCVFLYLTLPRAVVPLVVLGMGYVAFLYTSIPFTPVKEKVWQFAISGTYLMISAIFFACLLAQKPNKYFRVLSDTYLFIAAFVTLLGVGAYFGVMPQSEKFMRYGRVMATFQDPNVYGPYLVYPIVYGVMQMVYLRKFFSKLFYTGLVGVCALGVLFSFSRGAWGHLVVSVFIAIMCVILFVKVRKIKRNAKLIFVLAIVFSIIALMGLLSIEEVRTLMLDRAKLTQDYDTARLGRLARHAIGFGMIADAPLGYGPFHFSKIFGEAPHNVYLNAFFTAGWIGGLCYISLVLTTLFKLMRILHKPYPWQRYGFAVFATFLVLCLEGWIIDTDKWRHFYLLLGMAWALIAIDVRAKMVIRHYASSRQAFAMRSSFNQF